MDATNVLEDGSVKPETLPVVPAAGGAPDAGEKAQLRERPRWHTTAAIYAFSASLAIVTAGLCLKGPLQNLGPVRELLPQGAMFGIICRPLGRRGLGAGITALPRQHHAGRAGGRPTAHRVGLSGTQPARPQRRRRHPVRLRRPAQAGTNEGGLQRGRHWTEHRGGRRRLPRDPGHPQSGQPRRLGRGGGGNDRLPDRVGRGAAGRHAAGGPGGSEAESTHPRGLPRHADRGEHVPRLGVPRRRVVRPVDDAPPPPRRCADRGGLPGVQPPFSPLLGPGAPLRLQPDDGHGEPRTLVHERGRPEEGLHRHADPPCRAHPGRAVGHPPADHLRRPRGVGHRIDHPPRGIVRDRGWSPRARRRSIRPLPKANPSARIPSSASTTRPSWRP